MLCVTQHIHAPQLHETEKLSEKYPSFELVLNFVKNDALTVDKVHSLLQQREKLAKSVASVYYFIAEYIQSIREQLFEVCVCICACTLVA